MSLVDSQSNTNLWLAYSARRLAAVAIDGLILANFNLFIFRHNCVCTMSWLHDGLSQTAIKPAAVSVAWFLLFVLVRTSVFPFLAETT